MTLNDHETFQLNSDQVHVTFISCLPEGPFPADHDFDADPTLTEEIDGIAFRVRFDRAKLASHAELILAMLLELPLKFRESTAPDGGGWSFLNACDDRHSRQWTGLHRSMSELFCLGMGLGLVRCLVPREMWEALPGGMPYYVVLDVTGGPEREEKTE